MKTKNKIIKTAKVCYKLTRVLYIISIVLSFIFVILACIIPFTKLIKGLSRVEISIIFSTLALYLFISVFLLLNVKNLFKSVEKEKSPFGVNACKYLKNIAIFLIIISIIPALISSTLIKIIQPTTELTFPISLGGIISGIVTLIFALFFKYGMELQKNEDETL